MADARKPEAQRRSKESARTVANKRPAQCIGPAFASSYFLLPAANVRYRDPLRFHQGFQKRDGVRERIRASLKAAGAAGGVEGRAAAGVFGGQVGAVGDEEFDELIEAVFDGSRSQTS